MKPVPAKTKTSKSEIGKASEAPRTTLMFPFVTNQADFDTGIVTTNASAAPFGEMVVAGNCAIHYFGNVNGGPAPDTVFTPYVPPGGQLVFTLAGGGGVFGDGFTSAKLDAPLFQGCLAVECYFPNAYGYAHMMNARTNTTSSSYLATVIPNRS